MVLTAAWLLEDTIVLRSDKIFESIKFSSDFGGRPFW